MHIAALMHAESDREMHITARMHAELGMGNAHYSTDARITRYREMHIAALMHAKGWEMHNTALMYA